ncbi:pyrroline-5-carboxylate reductase [bacterium BMS3Bbin11]|nr:pyrroline-5-carboxylate reductase [bacterium BMS3Abin11]GBE46411.1 pyrroline-5-carboxylate reductase [bacterium BMS3Bbin11]GMT39470.1 MAG: pyrroline-5-carboxylate reductase [bacterium]HDH08198.1 pyrroline-5-carboxylate reductase [Gammaproteobacteria bacterium]HDH15922.1 pyrroline-5-carboxylate reductase [Gammaproteobacteria bacterium]
MNTLGIIGGGNMAESLIGGLLASAHKASAIQVSEPDKNRREYLSTEYGIHCLDNNSVLAGQSDILLFAVKPQLLRQVAEPLKQVVQAKHPLIISIVAGVRSSDLDHWLGGGLAIVRIMPNTPALVRAGASGLYANHLVNTQQRDLAESILRSVGITVWLENEAQMDIVTALSGSGPAYIFRVIEAMEEVATRAGLERETSRLLAIETVLGAARLAMESDDTPAELRCKVTSPRGTTEKGLQQLELGNIEQLFDNAINAAIDRSREMGDELGADS